MTDRENEYRALFLAEAQESYDKISSYTVRLEKDPANEELVGEIFRLLHNMKANAASMDLEAITELAHKLESIFTAIRSGDLTFRKEKVDTIFKAIDYLGYLINNIDDAEIQSRSYKDLSLDEIITRGQKRAGEKGKPEDSKLQLPESVSIPLKKLDELLNMVGELFISRDHIMRYAEQMGNQEMKSITQSLSRVADNIQDTVLTARLISVASLFNKFPKIIRDIATDENKKVNLVIRGEETTIDRNVLKIISDIMIHLIRNAISHGIELPEERVNNKKKEEGHLVISANSEKGRVYISVSDDGRGIDGQSIKEKAVERNIIPASRANRLKKEEALGLLFTPGFSMADQVTEYAGRGVGLDIVKNVIDSIGGDIKVESQEGQGTKFTMALPISMAVKAALLFKVGLDHYAVPLLNIYSVVSVPAHAIHKVGDLLVLEHKNESIQLIYLNDFLYKDWFQPTRFVNLKREVMDIVIIWYNNKKYGLIVDQLLRQQEIMIKPLQKPLEKHELFSGITLLSSGDVCYVLDVAYTTRVYEQQEDHFEKYSH